MNIKICLATEADLPSILALYAQPDMYNGKILPLDQAKALFEKINPYPYYLYM